MSHSLENGKPPNSTATSAQVPTTVPSISNQVDMQPTKPISTTRISPSTATDNPSDASRLDPSIPSIQSTISSSSNTTTKENISSPSSSSINPNSTYQLPLPKEGEEVEELPSKQNTTSPIHLFIRHFKSKTPSEETILVVVNYHFKFYKTVPFFERKFFPLFQEFFQYNIDVLFVGPGGNSKYKVVNNNIPIAGILSYNSLLVAYERLCIHHLCNYKGFLVMNDDSHVDPRFLMKYDLSHSWTEPSRKLNWNEKWVWLKGSNYLGVPYPKAFMQTLKDLKNTEWYAKCHFQRKNNHRRGFADFYYIVNSDMKAHYEMMKYFLKRQVFLEMAVPTVNWCLTHRSVDDCNHFEMKNRKTCVHMHPVKLLQNHMEQFSMNRLLHKNLGSKPHTQW